jgi:hypothetical protein
MCILKVELTIASDKGATEKRSTVLLDTAISSASQDGFLHHAALASERAGLYFLFLEDEIGASRFLSRACILYKEWGAGAKVKQLVSRYEKYLNAHPESFESLYRSTNNSGSLMFTDSGHGPATNPRRRSHISQPKNGPIDLLSNNSYHGPPSNRQKGRKSPSVTQIERNNVNTENKRKKEKSKRDELGSQSEHPRGPSLMRIGSWAKRRSASKEKLSERVTKRRTSLIAKKEKSKRDELGSQSEHPRRPSLMRIGSLTKRRSASKEKYEAQGREEFRTPKTPRRKLKNVTSRRSPSGERSIRSRDAIAKKPSLETARRKSLLSTPRKKKKSVPLVKTDDWVDKFDIDEFDSSDDDDDDDDDNDDDSTAEENACKSKQKNRGTPKSAKKKALEGKNSSRENLPSTTKKKKKNIPLVKTDDWVDKFDIDKFNSRKDLLSTPKKKKKNVPLVKSADWIDRFDIDEFDSSDDDDDDDDDNDDDDDSTAEENAGKSKQKNRGTPKRAKKKSLEGKNNTKLEESFKIKRSTQRKKKVPK